MQGEINDQTKFTVERGYFIQQFRSPEEAKKEALILVARFFPPEKE